MIAVCGVDSIVMSVARESLRMISGLLIRLNSFMRSSRLIMTGTLKRVMALLQEAKDLMDLELPSSATRTKSGQPPGEVGLEYRMIAQAIANLEAKTGCRAEEAML